MSRKKEKRLQLRLSDIVFGKLNAICKTNCKTRTAVIEDLILSEYGKNKAYEKWFYDDIGKKS